YRLPTAIMCSESICNPQEFRFRRLCLERTRMRFSGLVMGAIRQWTPITRRSPQQMLRTSPMDTMRRRMEPHATTKSERDCDETDEQGWYGHLGCDAQVRFACGGGWGLRLGVWL